MEAHPPFPLPPQSGTVCRGWGGLGCVYVCASLFLSCSLAPALSRSRSLSLFLSLSLSFSLSARVQGYTSVYPSRSGPGCRIQGKLRDVFPHTLHAHARAGFMDDDFWPRCFEDKGLSCLRISYIYLYLVVSHIHMYLIYLYLICLYQIFMDDDFWSRCFERYSSQIFVSHIHACRTLHPTPYTMHPTPYTLHPTPYALNAKHRT